MEWLNPAGAWAFLGVLPVIALYLLKRKARRTPVPSLVLWKKTEERTRQNRPFQRLRSQLLLWLQLAMVALLSLALMRPVTAGGLGGERVFIFDLSANMQAVDGEGLSRLEDAKRQALGLLEGMRDGDAVTVLAAGQSFSPLVSRSTDHAMAGSVIRGLEALNRPCEVELYSDSQYVVNMLMCNKYRMYTSYIYPGLLQSGQYRTSAAPIHKKNFIAILQCKTCIIAFRNKCVARSKNCKFHIRISCNFMNL